MEQRRQSGLPRPSSAAAPGAPSRRLPQPVSAATSSAGGTAPVAPPSSSRFGFRAPSGAASLAAAGSSSSAASNIVSGMLPTYKRTASQAGVGAPVTGSDLDDPDAAPPPTTRRAFASSTSSARPAAPERASSSSLVGATPSRLPPGSVSSVPRAASVHQSLTSHPFLASSLSSSTSSPCTAAAPADPHAVAELERKLLVSSSSYDRLERNFRDQGSRLARLENQRVELLRAWEELQNERKEEREAWETQKATLEAQLSAIRSERAALSETNVHLSDDAASLRQKLHTETTTMGSELARLKAEVQTLTTQSERDRAERQRIGAELEEREAEWAQERDSLSRRIGEGQGSSTLTEELNRQVAHVRTLEASNARLRSENERLQSQSQGLSVLREEKGLLESKVRGFEESRREWEKSESRVQELEEERSTWQAALQADDSAVFQAAYSEAAMVDDDAFAAADHDAERAPSSVELTQLSHYLARLRGSRRGLVQRCQLLQQRCQMYLRRVDEVEQRVQTGEKQALALRSERDKLRDERQRAEAKAQMAAEEARRYRDIYETYEMESKSQPGHYDAAQAERIASLEDKVRKLEADLAARQAELERATSGGLRSVKAEPGGVGGDAVERETLERRVEELQVSLQQATAAQAAASQAYEREAERASRFEMRLGRGEYDASQERVLEMRANPLSKDLAVRTSTLERYRAENEKLLERIRELEAAEAPARAQEVGAPSAAAPHAAEELELVKELRATIETKDKVLLRLRQTFSAKAKEYRETFESLFGYKLKYLEDGRVRLTSTFARSRSGATSLLFRSHDGDVADMRLQGEALRSHMGVDVASLKEYWLGGGDGDGGGGGRQSVPCFLAALQLELYESTTRALRGGWATAGAADGEED